MKRLALAVALLIGLATPSQADYQAGKAALDRGDYATAFREFKTLAEQGNAGAQFLLGRAYGLGWGVPKDFVLAHMWFSLAASRTPPGKHRDIAVEDRDIIAESMTPAQIAEAQRLAREWKPKPE